MRDDFAALREQDQNNAPSFDEMVRARPPARRGLSPIVFVLPAAAMFAAAAAFAVVIGTRHDAEPPAASAARPAASDPEPLGFLLDEPPALARFTAFDEERRR